MTRTLLISSFICGALAIGCGDSGKGNEDSNTTPPGSTSDGNSETGGGSSTGSVDPSKATEPGEETGAQTGDEPTTDPTGGFIIKPDGGNTIEECDVFAQDCAEGEKCTAWASDGGGAWNATKCVEVTGNKVPGDTCMTEGGGVSGIDDCQKGAMCWDVSAENQGVCAELCKGTEENPTCTDPDQVCAVVNDGVLTLCLDVCEPLVQDCPGSDDLCLPVGGSYACVLDASGTDAGKAFDPCMFANACDKGLICYPPAAATECNQGVQGCCLPMCSIETGGVDCPGEGQKCAPIYTPQPVGFEDVGVCSIPMG